VSRLIGRLLWVGLLALTSPPDAVASETDGPGVLVDGLVRAWNVHDAKAFAALFAEDADFVNVAGTLWKGRAEIQAKHEAAHAARFKTSTLAATSTVVRRLGSDVAILHFRWELTGAVDAPGQASPPRPGVMQLVAARQADGWRIVAAQNTAIVSQP
jgi:uncharacterized protein (TIGR02246 family)